MRIVRTSFALVGVFLVAAGILLGEEAQDRGSGAVVGIGLLYIAAGVVLIAWSLAPKKGP